ncbi:EAL domain-containing protein [Alcaligenaceae bacterium]|nr:EAL domain-containing protein [Alcaligenaceae bacterium]
MRLCLSSASLRVRLLLLILAALLPAVAMLIFQGIQNNRAAYQTLVHEAESLTYQIATIAKETLPDPSQILGNLAAAPELRQDGPACDELLAATLQRSFYLKNIVVILPNGDLTCSGQPQAKPINLADAPDFQKIMGSKATIISGLRISLNNTYTIGVFAHPVRDDQQNITRIIAISLNVTSLAAALNRALDSSPRFQGIAATILDSSGNVLAAAPEYEPTGQNARYRDQIKTKLDPSGVQTQRETWRNGVLNTTAYLPLYASVANTLYLRIGVPLAEPQAAVRRTTLRNWLVVIIGSLLALAAAWLLSNWLVIRPISVLNRTATRLGLGDFSARTGLGNNSDEIGSLARQFDDMAEQLQHKHLALLRISRVQAVRSATNGAVLRAHSEKKLLADVCEVIQEIGGYELAWVGYVPTDPSMPLQLQAHSGANDKLLTSFARSSWNERSTDHEPVTRATHSGATQVFQDLSIATERAQWRTEAAAHGCASAIGLPLQVAGTVIGGLGIFSTDPQAFGSEEIQLLTETANDLSFGLSALRAANEVRRSQAFLGLVINNIPSMVFVKDAQDLRFVSMNPAGEALTGFREKDIIGKTDHELFPAEQAALSASKDRAALNGTGKVSSFNELITTKSGEIRLLQTKKLPLLDAEGKPKYLLGIADDITEQQKVNQQLNYLATHDTLTSLPNRSLLLERLMHATSHAKHNHQRFALLYVDIDAFKEINDTLGHFTGDKALKKVSRILRSAMPQVRTIARVGGDEFVLLLEDITGKPQAASAATHLKSCFQRPFKVEGREVFMTISQGISIFPDDADHGEALLRIADIAMYHAKSQGRNTYVFYSHDLNIRATEKLEMRNLLRNAIDKNELILHYQPKVSMQTGKIIGAEALIRWNCADHGLIPPGQFIPLAEESGLIIPIGEWVLRTACAQAMSWQEQGLPPIVMAINLSPRQFRQADLRERIQHTLAYTRLRPEYLELEVTETAIMDNAASAIVLLNNIHDMGVNLAIDDFGTGYSSLAYLKQLPVSVLKVDQSFVQGLTSEANDAAIVTAVIAMAKSLHLAVTAEGVETQEQLNALKKLGCDNYQGYFFSKPLPADEFTALLRSSG